MSIHNALSVFCISVHSAHRAATVWAMIGRCTNTTADVSKAPGLVSTTRLSAFSFSTQRAVYIFSALVHTNHPKPHPPETSFGFHLKLKQKTTTKRQIPSGLAETVAPQSLVNSSVTPLPTSRADHALRRRVPIFLGVNFLHKKAHKKATARYVKRKNRKLTARSLLNFLPKNKKTTTRKLKKGKFHRD
jgi:hypothetical protein